jgi:uncharacterized protein YkwD
MFSANKLTWLALLSVTPACAFSAHAQEFAVPASARTTIISETNAYRAASGLAPLRESAGATQAAQRYARYLALNNKTGHRADGRSPAERVRAAGVRYCKFRGENWHQSWTRPNRATVEAAMAKAMRFWKGSPGHERIALGLDGDWRRCRGRETRQPVVLRLRADVRRYVLLSRSARKAASAAA